jgi:hypothetical protein
MRTLCLVHSVDLRDPGRCCMIGRGIKTATYLALSHLGCREKQDCAICVYLVCRARLCCKTLEGNIGR